jgi:cytochrome c-type biogenesis protein CcmI
MSTHLIFILAVLLTTVLVVLTLMSRLLRSAHRQQPVHNDANARIYQEQLAELQTEHQEGRLTTTAFEQACDELTRRLLRDTEAPVR